MKLTEPQRRHLRRIADPASKGTFPAAGWFGTKSEKKLEALGLVRHWTEISALGGGVGLLVRWKLVEITEAGQQVLREAA